ncbi:hypothetical protein MPSEU_000223100 [Mayamaea pseudoterrestris]|nr:hypothetical protein MPSEU_000223100 [Mayamaea pseudoterrestris]
MNSLVKYALIAWIIACAMLVLGKQLSLQHSLMSLLWPTDAAAGSTEHQQQTLGNFLLEPERMDKLYEPSSSEKYVVDHAEELGLLADTWGNMTMPSCRIFTDPTLPTYSSLQSYRKELEHYTQRANEFTMDIKDLRIPLRAGVNREELCSTLDLNLTSIFKESQQLSHGTFGYAEPLIPPMRHPDVCFDPEKTHKDLIKMTYMVHDWEVMCKRLTPFSRTVFIDMGASLTFHKKDKSAPAVYILDTYKKFGFVFDHVYAFEITGQAPTSVFELVPSSMLSQYHWINVGVEADPEGKMNPLRMLLEHFTEEDFVVIKLDIDHSAIEVPLAYQLLNDDRYSKMVDQFYFEHHVFQVELAPAWASSMQGSIKMSMDLFGGLRKKGIAAHFWV